MASEANEGTKRMWHVEGTSLRMHESGFYTTVAMFGSQEMADDFSQWLQRAEAAERLAENLQDAVVEMISHAREHGDTEFVSAAMDALNDEIGVIRDRLQAEIDDNRQRAETAEQRAADIETRTAVKLGEFAKLVDVIDAECKRLGIQWHGSVSTTLKAVIEAGGMKAGDVLLRPTGEVRKVRDGEWFRNSDDRYIRHDGYLTVSKFPIYRRIDAPADANQIADAGKMVAPAQPAKPETGKADEIVEINGKRYRREAEARLPKKGEIFDDNDGSAMAAGWDYENSRFHILHEITDEPTPSPHVETGGQEANVREIITQAVTEAMRLIYVAGHGAPVTPEDRDQIIDDAVRAIQPQAEIESQLAKLKQQAEAWEKQKASWEKQKAYLDEWKNNECSCSSCKTKEAFAGYLASQLSASQADQKGDG